MILLQLVFLVPTALQHQIRKVKLLSTLHKDNTAWKSILAVQDTCVSDIAAKYNRIFFYGFHDVQSIVCAFQTYKTPKETQPRTKKILFKIL